MMLMACSAVGVADTIQVVPAKEWEVQTNSVSKRFEHASAESTS